MTISRKKRSPFSALAAVLLLSVLSHCELPPGCGPGDVPSNPLASNLIEYTKPASGAILFQEDFTEFKVTLLRPMDKSTFSVADDVRLFEISNFWQADREEVPYPGGAGVVFSQAPWVCPGASCDQIDLLVNSSVLEPLRHYRIRILGAEAADSANPGVRPLTLISTPPDDGAVALAHDVDIIIGVGLYIPWLPIPELSGATPPLFDTNCQDPESPAFDASMCYLSPHEPLGFNFNSLMGYVDFDAEPLTGFNFAYTTERLAKDFTVLRSDSILGLLPGEHYVMDFPAEKPPEGTSIPRTTDRFGRSLKESVHLEFNTSHVRIFLPTHDPAFSATRLPDLWYKLTGYSPEYPWFSVEATSAVRRLSATDPDGTTAGVVFSDIPLPANRTENSFHVIYPSEVPGRPGCPTAIEVYAYGADDEYLGKDSMQVYAYPPPEQIKIITYNSYSNKSISPSPLPGECASFPYPCMYWCPGLCPNMDPLMCYIWCNSNCPDWCADLLYTTWSERLDNFVHDIVVPYKPAIIAVQEVMLNINGPWLLCEDLNEGDYLHHMVDKINQELGRSSLDCGKYYLATSVKSGHGYVSTCDRWEGEAIIYDSQQVRFIYPHPRPGAQDLEGCREWYGGQQDLYESQPYGSVYNDCMTKSGLGGNYEDGDNASISRAVFEFPLHSNRYFNFYNVHHDIPPCAIPESITDYIQDRQNSFRNDLENYLLDDHRAKKPFWIYPPVYAGDMNNPVGDVVPYEAWMDACNLSEEQRNTVRNSFVDAPTSASIDKVWLGKTAEPGEADYWIHDFYWETVHPPYYLGNPIEREMCREEWYPPFTCFTLGYYLEGEDNIYSDHSPAMVEIEVVQKQ